MARQNGRKAILLHFMSEKAVETRGRHGFGVFDKAVSSWFDNVSEEHGLTEDGKTVPPIIRAFFSKNTTSQVAQTSNLRVVSSGRPRPPVGMRAKPAPGH